MRNLFLGSKSSNKLVELGLILLSVLEREMCLAQVIALLSAVVLAAGRFAPVVIVVIIFIVIDLF